MAASNPTLGTLLHAFFEDFLKAQKASSAATVSSYRDALLLFIGFLAKELQRKLTRIPIDELTADRVIRFLQFLEDKRGNRVRTRNQRLTALKSFFGYIATQVPELLLEAERVAMIPIKRTAPPETFYLERDQIDMLFSKLPSTGHFALRDRTLLLFLYNTGARVQEVSDLRRENLELTSPLRVHLHGKGDKWRTCPLWESTAALLTQLLEKQSSHGRDSPVFVSARHRALTRFGIYKIVQRHTQQLISKRLQSPQQKISPHCFRHTAAVHLLESGVEVNVIRAWLGHVSLETTNRYAEITLRMKAEALKVCEPQRPMSGAYHGKVAWRDDPALLKWLKSL